MVNIMDKKPWRPFQIDEHGELIPKPVTLPEDEDMLISNLMTRGLTMRVVDPELEKTLYYPSEQHLYDTRMASIAGITIEAYHEILTLATAETYQDYSLVSKRVLDMIDVNDHLRMVLNTTSQGQMALFAHDKYKNAIVVSDHPSNFSTLLARYCNLDTNAVVGVVSYEPQPELEAKITQIVTDEDIKAAFALHDEREMVVDTVVLDSFQAVMEQSTSQRLPDDEDDNGSNTKYPPIIIDHRLFKHVKTIEERMATSTWVKKEWYIRPAQYVLTGIVFIPRDITGDGMVIR